MEKIIQEPKPFCVLNTGEGGMMQTEVKFAGFGGQGIMMIGKILAQAAMQAGSKVVWIPSYGPEMRGGTAYCTVVMSDRSIGSPIIQNPQHLVAMNRPSLEKFASTVKTGGIIFINSSLISIHSGRPDVDEFVVPIIDIAKEIGNAKVSNIVALGAFVARSKIVDFELVKGAVKEEFADKKKLIPMNLEALKKGWQTA
jgi:2-oxoglutarate ferredoxin oxidoreductase subunit gamma